MSTKPFTYTKWRHGGWYTNVRYPSGAVGCVARDLMGTRWQVVCQPHLGTYPTRDCAAQAEADYILRSSKASNG